MELKQAKKKLDGIKNMINNAYDGVSDGALEQVRAIEELLSRLKVGTPNDIKRLKNLRIMGRDFKNKFNNLVDIALNKNEDELEREIIKLLEITESVVEYESKN